MAISTYGVTLKWKLHSDTSGTMTKYVDIKSFPDLIGDPNLIDTTTLSDGQQTNIAGILKTDTLQFVCNMESEMLGAGTTQNPTVKSMERTELDFELSFGPVASPIAKATWSGQYTLGVPGKGVDDCVEITINVVNSTVVTLAAVV